MNTRLFSMLCFISIALCMSTSCTIPDWRHVTVSPLENIRDDGFDNPVLEAADVTDIEGANFVADPFLFYESGTWYMFFEVGKRYLNHPMHWGRIGLATSTDGIHWAYDCIVLDEIVLDAAGVRVDPDASLHHSYPQVIRHNGIYYMVTEAYLQHQVRFFQADNFPYDWRLVFNIAEDGIGPVELPRQCFGTSVGYIDPSIFRHNDKWWIYGSKDHRGYLYYSDRLLGGWQAHPGNPVVPYSPDKARPGGRVIVYDGNRIIRIAQEWRENRYGVRVRAFDVTTLSETSYDETEIDDGAPFCTDGGVFCEVGTSDICDANITSCEERDDIWNLCGMHQLDAWWTGEHWLLVTDGYKCLDHQDNWAIGMFISGPPASTIRDPYLERECDPCEVGPDSEIDERPEVESEPEVQVSPEVNR